MLTLPSHSIAEVYKWVDENGKIHFSDKPVDQESTEVKMKKQPTAAEILQAKRKASELINHHRKVSDNLEEEATDKQLAQEKEENRQTKRLSDCKDAKMEVRNLSRGYRSFILKENGERYFLSDKEKTEQIAKFEKAIAENCTE